MNLSDLSLAYGVESHLRTWGGGLKVMIPVTKRVSIRLVTRRGILTHINSPCDFEGKRPISWRAGLTLGSLSTWLSAAFFENSSHRSLINEQCGKMWEYIIEINLLNASEILLKVLLLSRLTIVPLIIMSESHSYGVKSWYKSWRMVTIVLLEWW